MTKRDLNGRRKWAGPLVAGGDPAYDANKMLSKCLSLLILLAVGILPLKGQGPNLIWQPTALTLNAPAGTSGPVTGKVTLTNFGSPTNFLAVVNQGWLTVSPMSGTLQTNGTVEFFITANPSGLQTGQYTGFLAVTPTGLNSVNLPVTFNVTGVVILTSEEELQMLAGPEGTDEKILEVMISDGLTNQIGWSAETQTGGNWLSVLENQPVNSPARLTVRVTAAGMDPGERHEGALLFSSPALPGYQKRIKVFLQVQERSPNFTVAPTFLTFYAFGQTLPPAQPLQILSSRGRITGYEITKDPDAAAVQLSQVRGLTPDNIGVSVDTTQLNELPKQNTITITPSDASPPYIIPVRTLSRPPLVRTIAQVADGGAYRTSITITNNDTAPALVTLRFYLADPQSGGTVPWNPQMLNNAPLNQVTIPVGGAWTVETAGATPEIRQGWAQVISQQLVEGTAIFRQTRPDGQLQEAAVPVTPTLMQRLLLPFDNTNGNVTAAAVVNLSQNEVSRSVVILRDPDGELIRIDRLKDLPPLGHSAFAFTDVFPYLQNRKGTADIYAIQGQTSLLGLRFNQTGAYTSFEAQSLDVRTNGRRSLPQIADGGPYTTEITLVNNDIVPARVQLMFHRSTGTTGATEAWPLALADGVNPLTIEILPGTSRTFRTAGLSPTAQVGWADVKTDQWVTGFATFRQVVPGRPDQEAAVPVNVGTPRRLVLPFDNTAGYTTTVALANLSTVQAASIIVVFRGENGLRIQQAQLPDLPANGHRAFALPDLFPAVAGLKGTVEFSEVGAGEMSIVGLRFASSGAYTSLKATRLPQ